MAQIVGREGELACSSRELRAPLKSDFRMVRVRTG